MRFWKRDIFCGYGRVGKKKKDFKKVVIIYKCSLTNRQIILITS